MERPRLAVKGTSELASLLVYEHSRPEISDEQIIKQGTDVKLDHTSLQNSQ
jgi:hypothetical protein